MSLLATTPGNRLVIPASSTAYGEPAGVSASGTAPTFHRSSVVRGSGPSRCRGPTPMPARRQDEGVDSTLISPLMIAAL
jgi:hypothetical protein